MLNAFEQGNFTYGSGRHAVVFAVDPDFLHSDGLVGYLVRGLENHAVSAFTQLLAEFIAGQLVFVSAEAVLLLSNISALGLLKTLFYHRLL